MSFHIRRSIHPLETCTRVGGRSTPGVSHCAPLRWGLVAIAGLLLLSWYLTQLSGLPLSALTRDAVAVRHDLAQAGLATTNPWIGSLSWLGVAGWAVAAIASVRQGRAAPLADSKYRWRRFCWATGAWGFMLGIDDALLLHERVLPQYFHLSESAIYGLYGALALWYLVSFWQEICHTPRLFIGLAGGFWAASIGLDRLFPAAEIVLQSEDLLKLIGILWWILYCCNLYPPSRNAAKA